MPAGTANPLVDKLKYQADTGSPTPRPGADVLTVKLRYQEPRGGASRLLAQPLAGVAAPIAQASADQQFAAGVAEFGLLLRQSAQRGTATYASAAQLAQAGRGPDPEGYRAELVRLAQLAEGMTPADQTTDLR